MARWLWHLQIKSNQIKSFYWLIVQDVNFTKIQTHTHIQANDRDIKSIYKHNAHDVNFIMLKK